jgi:hypothetical protein
LVCFKKKVLLANKSDEHGAKLAQLKVFILS